MLGTKLNSVFQALGSRVYPQSPLGSTRVVAFIGQSNCFGLGTDAAGVGLSTVDKIKYTYNHSLLSNPPVWKTEGRTPAKPRGIFISTSYPLNSWGPDLATANYLAANSAETWETCAMAIDGMSLKQHLLNAAYPLGGPPLLTQVKTFIQGVVSTCKGVLDTLVVVHGEADAVASPDNVEYAANLITLVNEMQATFGYNFKIVVVRLSSKYSNNSSNVIRAAQEGLQGVSDKVWIAYVDKYNLRDFAHFDDAGYKDLGYQIGSLILGNTKPSPRWWGSGVISTKTSTGSLTPTVPTQNKVAILAIAGIGNTAYVPPAGWTHISTVHNDSFLTSARLQLYWRYLQSGDSVTIDDLPADDAATAAVFAFDGLSQSAPVDVVATNTTTTASTTLTVPGATATKAGLAVLVGATEGDVASSQLTTPTGWEEHIDHHSTNASGTGLVVAVKPVQAGTLPSESWTLATSTTSATALVVLA